MKKKFLLFTPAILSLGYLVGCNFITSRYVITFNTQSESKIESQTVKNGSKVVEPISPSKTGYMFDKWTTDLEGKNVYNFETPVTKSFELYAQYSDNFHIVTFDLGDDKIEKKQIRDGEKISYSPTKEGYTFTHWELNGKIFYIDTPITSDIYLIAKFSVNSLKVSAVSESERKGTVTGSKVYEYGSLATLEATANNGYSFAYWTKDDETTVISDEPTYTFKVEKDASFTAHFNPVKYNISYNNVTEEELIASGNKRSYTIEEPIDIELKNPYRSGYSFKGWYTTSDFQIATKIERIAKGTTGDYHLYAKWEQSTNTRIVVFDTICITEILSPIEVESGNTIIADEFTPDKYNPVWADFDAWYYKDSTGTEQKFIFGPSGTGTVVNEDMYVYAKYKEVYDKDGTTGLTYSINSNGGYTASCYKTYEHNKIINIPSAVKFQNYYVLVNEIGDMGHFTRAVTINVPPTVKLINDRAFHDLYRLSEVKFISNGNDKNSQLLCISANAFYNSNIKKIVLPSNLLAIYENAFEDCDELISVYIDSDIVANFTDNSSYVFVKNKTREGIQRVVYVNKNIIVNDTSYLKTEGYTVGTEVEGYIPYTKASKVREE